MPSDIAVCKGCGQPTWRTRCAYCRPKDFSWQSASKRLLQMIANGNSQVLEEEFKDLAEATLAEMKRVRL